MGWRMKNFIIFGGHGKIRFLGGGHEIQYIEWGIA